MGGALIGTQGLALAAFFWGALLLGTEGVTRLLSRSRGWLLVMVAAVGVSAMLWLTLTTSAATPTEGADERSPLNVALGVVASSSGLCAVIALSAVLARFRGSMWLARLGRDSMTIYVAHVLFTAAVRILLGRFGLDQPIIHLVVGIVAGVVGPLAMAAVAGKVGFSWMFGRPQWLTVFPRPRSDVGGLPARLGR